MLVHRCGLVRAHDARGDVRVPFRFDRASPRLENYPQATTPHTTPSLDYLIVASSILFQPFTAHALDLAGTEPIKSRAAVWVAFTLSISRFLRDWDERLWPNEMEYALRAEQRNESVQLRDLAITLQSSQVRPHVAQWCFDLRLRIGLGNPVWLAIPTKA
ncbi:MAG TPA: hypothetical protein VNY07_11915 [Chthoniobacterales bacterium]|nr:hypothetical protein [Chthoniobacterales bacterium]